MNAPAHCPHCGFDLKLALSLGTHLSHCPGCGAGLEFASATEQEQTSPGIPPPSSPPARPAPPPRRKREEPNTVVAIEAPEASEANAAPNPFLMGAAPASSPMPPEATTPLAGAGSAQPQSVQVAHAPLPQTQGAPLNVDPEVSVPSLGDPHADFRKGRWQRPLLIIALAAGLIFAFFTLMPEAEEKELVNEDKKGGRAPIGGSVSPLILEEPELDLSEKKPSAGATPPPEAATSSSSPSSKGAFADSFKAQAK